jgi:ribosomal protein S18 acetylase RimI-like enzyme
VIAAILDSGVLRNSAELRSGRTAETAVSTGFIRKIRIAPLLRSELVCPRGTDSDPMEVPSTMHPLDNVIWQALTTRQAGFAEGFDQARRFVREITSLTAFREASSRGYESVGELVGPSGTAALFLNEPYEPRLGWSLVAEAPLLQMLCENGAPSRDARAGSRPQIAELGPQDSREMLELTALTQPGPFGSRTHELGTYLGIRCDGKLIAMAGERLKVPGYTEVSAVCTHPEHTGKGYAAVLMTEIMQRIRQRREIPFLHVRQDNGRAVVLYERLGFRKRVMVHLAVLRAQKHPS